MEGRYSVSILDSVSEKILCTRVSYYQCNDFSSLLYACSVCFLPNLGPSKAEGCCRTCNIGCKSITKLKDWPESVWGLNLMEMIISGRPSV